MVIDLLQSPNLAFWDKGKLAPRNRSFSAFHLIAGKSYKKYRITIWSKKIGEDHYNMLTVIENLAEMAAGIEALLRILLIDHSSIYMWNIPGGSFAIISPSGNYAFRELSEEGRRIQSKILEEYRCFNSLVSVLLQGQPQDTLKELEGADNTIAETIQQHRTWCKTTKEALGEAVHALKTELSLLGRLYHPSGGQAVYIPDTNALLYNTNLEKWDFVDTQEFKVVLLPTVLSELDSLKINHRNEEVRKKAESLIRMIKEYRRRGILTAGVPLKKGRSRIQALAIEPDMKAAFPWLDPTNNDDRFLAGVVEVMRNHPRSQVAAVTRDINLQNKAEFARIPIVEPPEP